MTHREYNKRQQNCQVSTTEVKPTFSLLWLISPNGDGDRDGSLYGEFPCLLRCTMQNFFHWYRDGDREIETIPDGYCAHFRDRSLSQFYYILIRGLESVSVPVEKPA